MRSSLIRWKIEEAIECPECDPDQRRRTRRILGNRRTRDAAIELVVLRFYRDEIGPVGEMSFWDMVLAIVQMIQENDAAIIKWLIETGIPLIISLFSGKSE